MAKEKNAKRDKKDRGNHVSFRSMLIAMIVALLAFLGIGNFDLGDGDGADVGSGDGTEVADTADDGSGDKTTVSDDAYDTEGQSMEFTVYIQEDKIFIDTGDGREEATVQELESQLGNLESGSTVVLYDDGALNSLYEEVEGIVDVLDLRKIEE